MLTAVPSLKFLISSYRPGDKRVTGAISRVQFWNTLLCCRAFPHFLFWHVGMMVEFPSEWARFNFLSPWLAATVFWSATATAEGNFRQEEQREKRSRTEGSNRKMFTHRGFLKMRTHKKAEEISAADKEVETARAESEKENKTPKKIRALWTLLHILWRQNKNAAPPLVGRQRPQQLLLQSMVGKAALVIQNYALGSRWEHYKP